MSINLVKKLYSLNAGKRDNDDNAVEYCAIHWIPLERPTRGWIGVFVVALLVVASA
jgi:hypothetical protein